ncbi:MAG: iron chelate uptake ABC transporter family permease subunit [Lachnospiraceae bacterium]
MFKKQFKILSLLLILAFTACVLFIVWGLNANNIAYNLPRRSAKIIAFIVTGTGIGISTVVFQTVTQNRILTPSVMGLDKLYMLIQTVLVFFLGSGQLAMLTRKFDYCLAIVLMSIFSLLLFKGIFKNGTRSITTVILAGIVFGSLFESLSTFMQVLIDPNEYLVIQDRIMASFNKVNTSLLGISSLIVLLCSIYLFFCHRSLDVMNLGRDISINLGINYEVKVTKFMLIISVMTAASTALVGPVTFLGLITANISRQMLATYRHSFVMAGAAISSIFAIAIGQLVIERIFNFGATLSVVINFVGGIYFIVLMLKEGKR